MKLIEEAITGWFGERCQEALEGCPCCDAWAEYDALTRLADALGQFLIEYDEVDLAVPEPQSLISAVMEARAAAKAVQHG